MRALIIKVIRVVRYIGYIIGLSLLIYQAYNGVLAIREGRSVLPGLGPSFLALFLSIIAQGFQIIAWWLIMRGLQSAWIPLKELFWGYTLSFLPRYIPGSIWGYMSRGNWLQTDFNINYRSSTLGSITELILMVGVNMILSSLVVLPILYNQTVVIIILFILLLLILPISLKRVRILIINTVNKVKLQYIFLAIPSLFLTWIFYGFSLFLAAEPYNALHSIGYNKINLFISIYSAAWLIGFLILFVPAGMGVRELALTRLLSSYALFEPQVANGLAILFRLVVTISEISWLILGWVIKKLFSSNNSFSKFKP
jgi:glycosyltransferase 2 family protein